MNGAAAARALLEQVFNCRVYDRYELTETRTT